VPGATATPTFTPTQTPIPGTGTATPVPCDSHFTDVPVDYWAYGYIKWAYCQGIVSGYADGTFHPEANLTRGQLAKVVVLAAGYPLTLPAGAPHFSDVPPQQPFYQFIEVGYAHGILSGYADGTFRPWANVTRAQVVKLIVNAQGYPLLNPATPHFSDVPVAHPFYRFIESAVAHQVVGGYDDGTFRPAANATRAQVSKILFQAFALPNRR
jgi:hypothetical protein